MGGGNELKICSLTSVTSVNPVGPPCNPIHPQASPYGCHQNHLVKISGQETGASGCVREGAPDFGQGAPSCAPGCGLGGRLGATDVRRLEGRKRRAAPPSPPALPPSSLLPTLVAPCPAPGYYFDVVCCKDDFVR